MTIDRRHRDPVLQRQYEEAVRRGDSFVQRCCNHIQYHHLERVCRACWVAGVRCPRHGSDEVAS